MSCATDTLFEWCRRLLLAIVLTSAGGTGWAAAPTATNPATCTGRFPNPITDMCWSCMFPLRAGGQTIYSDGQEDANSASGNPVCACSGNGGIPEVGIKWEFWEPARIFEAVRTPHCYPALGGVKLDPGFAAPDHASERSHDGKGGWAFYHGHWYTNPMLFWLEVMMDNPCLEAGAFDLAYATEFDPLWDDDLMAFFLAPDSALFANVIAQAACAADCVAATLGFSTNTLFWCAGCQGPMYPLTGWVGASSGGVMTSSLLLQRMTNKLHRQGLMWAGSGNDGLCTFYPQVVMDKTNYKSQMIFPIPNTAKELGRCCQPYGRTTVIWGAGKEFPYQGEDFAYQIFRKRSCCAGSSFWTLSAPLW